VCGPADSGNRDRRFGSFELIGDLVEPGGIEYIEAIAAAHAAGRKMATLLTNYDVILSTTLAGPPPKLGYFDQNGDVQTLPSSLSARVGIPPISQPPHHQH
jgi:hypothetical protein